jgi:hypothetical protein
LLIASTHASGPLVALIMGEDSAILALIGSPWWHSCAQSKGFWVGSAVSFKLDELFFFFVILAANIPVIRLH